MEFSGKLASEDLKDLAVLMQSRWYWPRFVLENWRGLGLVVMLVWFAIEGLLGRTKLNWWGVATLWAVIIGLSLWAWRKARREHEQELAQLNAALPEKITLTSVGIRGSWPDGDDALVLWSQFKGWRERRRVMVVDPRPGAPTIMFSVAHLSDIQRHSVRDFLRSQIPPSAA